MDRVTTSDSVTLEVEPDLAHSPEISASDHESVADPSLDSGADTPQVPALASAEAAQSAAMSDGAQPVEAVTPQATPALEMAPETPRLRHVETGDDGSRPDNSQDPLPSQHNDAPVALHHDTQANPPQYHLEDDVTASVPEPADLDKAPIAVSASGEEALPARHGEDDVSGEGVAAPLPHAPAAQVSDPASDMVPAILTRVSDPPADSATGVFPGTEGCAESDGETVTAAPDRPLPAGSHSALVAAWQSRSLVALPSSTQHATPIQPPGQDSDAGAAGSVAATPVQGFDPKSDPACDALPAMASDRAEEVSGLVADSATEISDAMFSLEPAGCAEPGPETVTAAIEEPPGSAHRRVESDVPDLAARDADPCRMQAQAAQDGEPPFESVVATAPESEPECGEPSSRQSRLPDPALDAAETERDDVADSGTAIAAPEPSLASIEADDNAADPPRTGPEPAAQPGDEGESEAAGALSLAVEALAGTGGGADDSESRESPVPATHEIAAPEPTLASIEADDNAVPPRTGLEPAAQSGDEGESEAAGALSLAVEPLASTNADSESRESPVPATHEIAAPEPTLASIEA
ncbi:MAG: hypothetical protein FWD68_08980, partial [Alphaproteobacteria bacterium]|nr:hypothetical protein [Alphaproteobacteria bacterium]